MKIRLLVYRLLLGLIIILPHALFAQNITTIAGCGLGNDSLATNAELVSPVKVVFDNTGNAYIADVGNNMVRRVDATGVITTFAGTGYSGYSGDGGPATAATFGTISSLAFDKWGNLLVVDAGYSVIRLINASGIISTVAGTGTYGYSGDGFAATLAQLNYPSDAISDTAGNIFIADRENYLVRKINASGIITTYAGNGTAVSTVFGVSATATSIGYPFRLTFDKMGNLLVGSYQFWHIMKIDAAGILTNIAGAGAYGFSGDGGPATAATFAAPSGLAIDTAGNIYFSDIDNERVRMVNITTGIITTVAGKGIAGYSGDWGTADSAEISTPECVSFDANNDLYVADFANNRVRKVSGGIMSTFAGQNGLFGEGYPGVNAEITNPQNLAVDPAGNVYIADINNHRVRMINAATGIMTTVAGVGISGSQNAYSGDGGPAVAAHLYYPAAVAIDASGNLYICDQDNQRIREVNTSGVISTFAGNGVAGYAGNATPATNAELQNPSGVAVDAAGNVYLCDNNNQRIRKVNTAGIITTIAGNGVAGYTGDAIAATMAELNYPKDVAVDGAGNVYICDQGNNRVRMINAAGIINTIAGDGSPGDGGDGGPATSAQLLFPSGLKVDNMGDVFIADVNNNCVRMINASGTITRLAGTGSPGFSGDGGPALAAMLNRPCGIAVDLSGNLYIADGYNHRVREVGNSYLSVPSTKAPGPPGVLIYPNPATGTINIINAANSTVIINDVAGNQVMKQPITNTTQTLDISSLAGGVYLILVINKNGETKVAKVIKE